MSRRRRALLTAPVLMLATLVACGGADLETVATEGSVLLTVDGQQLPLRVERMDVYLVDPEEEHEYPEMFRIHGPDLELVGTFPMALHVGYGEEFSRMIGKTVSVAPRANIDWEEMRSVVSLLGTEVRSGTLVVDRILGDSPDGAGQILEGTVKLTLAGERTASGSFVFLAKTWG